MKNFLPASLAFSLIVASNAANAADPGAGEALAKRWCASCHVVASDQKSAVADVPSFDAIAKKPGFDTAKLAAFILEPHPKMPTMAVTRIEADNIAAYIATLR